MLLSSVSRHTEADLRQCATDMCYIFKIAHEKRYYLSIFKKYSSPSKYYNVAEFMARKSEQGAKPSFVIGPPHRLD